MREWEVSIRAIKQQYDLDGDHWIERVKAIDQVEARNQTFVQAKNERPGYYLYDITSIIEIKA